MINNYSIEDENLLDVTFNSDEKDTDSVVSERDRIKNLIKGFELQERGEPEVLDSKPKYNNTLLFSLEIDNNNLNNIGATDETVEKQEKPNIRPISLRKALKKDKNAQPEILHQNDSLGNEDEEIAADVETVFENSQISDGTYTHHEDETLSNLLNSIETVSTEREKMLENDVKEAGLKDIFSNKNENTDNLIDLYIKSITELSYDIDEKKFLLDTDKNLSKAKTISNVTYINYAASVHIYKRAINDLQKRNFVGAKNAFKIISLTSISSEYVNMALSVLKDENLCTKFEFMNIVSKTMEKEKILIDIIRACLH